VPIGPLGWHESALSACPRRTRTAVTWRFGTAESPRGRKNRRREAIRATAGVQMARIGPRRLRGGDSGGLGGVVKSRAPAAQARLAPARRRKTSAATASAMPIPASAPEKSITTSTTRLVRPTKACAYSSATAIASTANRQAHR